MDIPRLSVGKALISLLAAALLLWPAAETLRAQAEAPPDAEPPAAAAPVEPSEPTPTEGEAAAEPAPAQEEPAAEPAPAQEEPAAEAEAAEGEPAAPAPEDEPAMAEEEGAPADEPPTAEAPQPGEPPVTADEPVPAEAPAAAEAQTEPGAAPEAEAAPEEELGEAPIPAPEAGPLPGVGAPPGPPAPGEMGPEAPETQAGPVDEAIADLAARLVAHLPERAEGAWVIGVLDFPDLQGTVGELGRYLAQRLTSTLSRTEGVEVVQRLRLSDLAAEMQIGPAGAADPTAARRLGNAAGANALVLGTVANLGQTIELDAHLRDLDSRQALPAEFVRVSREPMLAALAGNGAAPAPGAVDDSGQPVQRVYVLDDSLPPPGYENESYRVTVEQAERRGRRLTLVVAFESRSGSPEQLLFRDNPYLIDAQGDRWSLRSPDPTGIWDFCCGAGIELIPGTRRRTRLVFGTESPGNGTEFTLVGKEISPQRDRTVVLGGVALREAADN